MERNQGPRSSSSFSSAPQAPHPPAPPPAPRRIERRQRLRRGLAGCLLVGVAGYFVANLITSWMLHNELSSIVQRGEPLRFSQLAPPMPPEGQNAATLYLRADAALQLTKAEEGTLQQLRHNEFPAPDPNLLAKNQEAIRLTRQAAQLPGCRFPVEYDATNLAGVLLPHIAKLRRLLEVLACQAQWEAQNGQTQAALDDVATLFRMSDHLAPEPLLISGISTMAMERIGYKTLSRVLNSISLSPEQAHAFALRLGQSELSTMIRNDLRGERCFGLWAFQYVSNPVQASHLLDDTGGPPTHVGMKLLSLLWAPLWKLDEIEYLHAIDQYSTLLQNPGAPLALDDRYLENMPKYAICARIMLPVLTKVGYNRDLVLDYRRMALIALALHAYHTQQGIYPPNLQAAETAWGATLPHDVFTDQPFVYKTDGKTMQLYSTGTDRIDQGGSSARHIDPKTGKTSQDDDLAW